jgi:hypothetical protein
VFVGFVLYGLPALLDILARALNSITAGNRTEQANQKQRSQQRRKRSGKHDESPIAQNELRIDEGVKQRTLTP